MAKSKDETAAPNANTQAATETPRGGPGGARVMVRHKDSDQTESRVDVIRTAFEAGVTRGDIRRNLKDNYVYVGGEKDGQPVDVAYQIIFQATKQKATAEATAPTSDDEDATDQAA